MVLTAPVMMVIEMMTSIGETEVPSHEYKKAPVGVGTEWVGKVHNASKKYKKLHKYNSLEGKWV